MSLYEDQFDTEWDSLGRDEALERAFALGVAASLGERNAEEYEAVAAEMESNYDASIVELAYTEGKNKAAERKRDPDSADDDAEVYQWVLSEELEGVERPDQPARDDEPSSRATDLPKFLADLPEVTERQDPSKAEQTDYPDFLE